MKTAQRDEGMFFQITVLSYEAMALAAQKRGHHKFAALLKMEADAMKASK